MKDTQRPSFQAALPGGVLQLITDVVVGAILELTQFIGKAVIFLSGVPNLKQVDLGNGFSSIRYFRGFGRPFDEIPRWSATRKLERNQNRFRDKSP